MGRIFGAWIEMIAAAVFFVPVLVCYGRRKGLGVARFLWYLLFGLYFVAVLALVGFPNVTSIHPELAVHLIPFAGMAADLENTCLNVLLFVPLGFFLPVLWEHYGSLKKTAVFAAGMSGLIELSQLFNFRATDINDLIANSVGAVLGYLAAAALKQGMAKHIAPSGDDKELYFICGAVAIIAFALQPFVSSALWGLLL